MYHVSAQGIDERMINVHYYYITCQQYSVLVWSPLDRQTDIYIHRQIDLDLGTV